MSKEGFTYIYRVVSQAELRDLETTGQFRMGPCPTYEHGKLFAVEYQGAFRFKGLVCKWEGHLNTTIVTAYIPLHIYERGDRVYTDGFESRLILAEDLRFLERIN